MSHTKLGNLKTRGRDQTEANNGSGSVLRPFVFEGNTMNEQTEAANILSTLAHFNNPRDYQELHWEGSFEDYLKLVRENPRVTRNAFQRIYDMILSHGTEEYTEHKKKIVRYKFFRDEQHGGRDAVYGIDQSLNHLVDTFKAAARNYGPERRVILLHGPVGSAKSTIVRLLKKGLEEYSRTADGAHVHLRLDERDPGNRKRDVPGHATTNSSARCAKTRFT